MKRLATAAAAVGGVLVAVAVVVALVTPTSRVSTTVVALPFALVAAGILLWKLQAPLESPADRSVPWDDADAFATPPPERTDDDYPLSSADLARLQRAAGEVARSEGTVEAGVAEVRPVLRETLVDALTAGRRDRDAVSEAVDAGDWTDDRVAASVLSESVAPPRLSLRRRAFAWLFPERVVDRRIRRAVQALSAAAEDALPTVPGQTAPRTATVSRPVLSELQRGADGQLQRAIDREVIARGPEPPAPDLDADDGGGSAPDDGEAVDGDVERGPTGGAPADEEVSGP